MQRGSTPTSPRIHGEDKISAHAKDENVRPKGAAFDLTADRARLDFTASADRQLWTETIEINRKRKTRRDHLVRSPLPLEPRRRKSRL